jgi:NAD(P)-dependent dehydrogenase (short-subunit alcohol dehydrogenase family)
MSKVWLITGSGSGLGRAIADAALKAGHQVVATARHTDQLSDLVAQFGRQVLAFRLDVTLEEEGKAAVRAAVETFGRLDVLVNNAGYGDTRPFEQVPSSEFRQLVETCLFGVVNLTRAALPVMRQQRSGHIIQISSLGGRTAFPGNAAYFASKWGVGGFTEGVALETAPFGVKLTALESGAMRTNRGRRAHAAREPLLPDYEPSVGASMKRMEAYGATKVAILPRSRRSSWNWPAQRCCHRISCSAAMHFDLPVRLTRQGPRTRSAGERSASPSTLTLQARSLRFRHSDPSSHIQRVLAIVTAIPPADRVRAIHRPSTAKAAEEESDSRSQLTHREKYGARFSLHTATQKSNCVRTVSHTPRNPGATR